MRSRLSASAMACSAAALGSSGSSFTSGMGRLLEAVHWAKIGLMRGTEARAALIFYPRTEPATPESLALRLCFRQRIGSVTCSAPAVVLDNIEFWSREEPRKNAHVVGSWCWAARAASSTMRTYVSTLIPAGADMTAATARFTAASSTTPRALLVSAFMLISLVCSAIRTLGSGQRGEVRDEKR